MSKKTLTLLGFASKAGKLSYGMNAALTAVNSKKSELLIVSSDVSAKSFKEITYYSKKNNLPVIALGEDMQELSSAVGRSCGVVSVNDKNFAISIISQEEKV